MIGGKIVQWTVRFILIGLYLLLGYLIISTAFSQKADGADPMFQELFSRWASDAVQQDRLNEDIFSTGYYDDLFGGAEGFGMGVALKSMDGQKTFKQTYYQKDFFLSRRAHAMMKGDEYAYYTGSLIVKHDGSRKKLEYEFVMVR